jgi:hypothetical protein
MSSVFIGKTGLRHRYADMTVANINTTTGASDAVLLETFTQEARLCYFFNSFDIDLALWVVHPDADSTVTANRLKLLEFPANFNLNYDLHAANLSFDVGMTLFISKVPGVATNATVGKFRLIYFG